LYVENREAKSMNKILLGALGLAFVTISSPASAAAYEGFYIGGRLGLTYADAKVSGSSYSEALEETETYSQKPKTNGFAFGGLAGYNWIFDNIFIIGLNVAIDYNNITNTKTSTGIHGGINIINNLTRRFSFTPSLKVGGCITENVVLYGQLGATIGWFRLHSFTNQPGDVGTSSASTSKKLWGIRPAIGIEYHHNYNLAFTLEISRDIYNQRIRQTEYQFVNSVPETYNNASSMKPIYTSVLFGVNYKF